MRKNQLYITIGNFVYLVSQWAFTVVVVRFSSDFYMAGLLGLAITVSNIFFIIASYGLRSYQVSDIKKEFSDQCYVLTRLITVPVACVACIVYSVIKGYNAETIMVIGLYMVYKALEALSDVFHGILQIYNKYLKICISMSIKGILALIVFTVALLLKYTLIQALLCMNIVVLITLITMEYRWSLQCSSPLVLINRTNIQASIRLLRVSILMVVLSIAQPLLMSIPRLYFEQHYSTELLGIYSSLSSPTVAITTLVSCALMPYIPVFAEYYKNGNVNGLSKLMFLSLGLTAAFGVIAFFAGGIAGDWILSVLYGSTLRDYVPVFQLIILVSTFSSMNMCMIVLYTSMRKLAVEASILLTGSVICYFITPYLVTNYNMAGITYALMAAQLFQVFFAVVFAVFFIRKSAR